MWITDIVKDYPASETRNNKHITKPPKVDKHDHQDQATSPPGLHESAELNIDAPSNTNRTNPPTIDLSDAPSDDKRETIM